ncbi:hypothetical protein [Coleofasciculus sp. FACHB-129]|nr:hypothetical protein [Coleofasciculus sp. FACHB-129]
MTSESKGKLEILKAAADISDWGYGRWAYEQWEISTNSIGTEV